MAKFLLSITPTFILNLNDLEHSYARPKIDFPEEARSTPPKVSTHDFGSRSSIFSNDSQTTIQYIQYCRDNNKRFYRKKMFNLDSILTNFGPWVLKLNEESKGMYTKKPIFFMLTFLEHDEEEEYETFVGPGRQGIMFGSISYEDYYPSGEIVIECLRHRYKGYKTVMVEFLFAAPLMLTSSIEDLFIKGLPPHCESLNYTDQLPTPIDFHKVFYKTGSATKVLDTFFESNKKFRSLLNYLPKSLDSSIHLFAYYQDQFVLKYSNESQYLYSYYESHESILDSSTYFNYNTKTPYERAVSLSSNFKPILSYNRHGIVYSEDSQTPVLTVKSLSLRSKTVSTHMWDGISNELGSSLFLRPFHVSGGLVYSLSENALELLAEIDQTFNNNDYIGVFDKKVLQLFEIFDI